MSFTHAEKLTLLANLIRLASADGEHRDEEYDYLHRITEELEVEPMDMENLFTENHLETYPKEESTRILIVHYLLELIYIDQEVSLDEVHLLKEMMLKLGLSIQAIETLLSQTRMLGKVPDLNQTIEAFKVQRN